MERSSLLSSLVLISFSNTAIHNKIFFKIVIEPFSIVNVSLNEGSFKLLRDESSKKKLPEKLIINATLIQKIAF